MNITAEYLIIYAESAVACFKVPWVHHVFGDWNPSRNTTWIRNLFVVVYSESLTQEFSKIKWVEKLEIQKRAKINISENMLQADLRHKIPSSAVTMGSWVRIQLEAWMYVWFYYACVLSCIDSGLATGWSPVQGALSNVYKIPISNSINF
jgi:hypothetical protein